MSPRARLTALIEGSLAANIFDWGAAACVELYHNGAAGCSLPETPCLIAPVTHNTRVMVVFLDLDFRMTSSLAGEHVTHAILVQISSLTFYRDHSRDLP